MEYRKLVKMKKDKEILKRKIEKAEEELLLRQKRNQKTKSTFNSEAIFFKGNQNYPRLILYYQNVRGLRTKIKEFRKNIATCSGDIVAITETNLVSSVADEELFPQGYSVLRKDRAGANNKDGGGGVLLAVRDSFNVQVINNIDGLTEDKEILLAKISINNLNVLICVVYMPPWYNETRYLSVLAVLENIVFKYPDQNILFLGDFNLSSMGVNVNAQFSSFLESFNLKQCNDVNNHFGGMLDLVLAYGKVNISNIRTDNVEPLVPVDSYHPPLKMMLSIQANDSYIYPQSSNMRTKSNPDWIFLKEEFHSFDWSDESFGEDLDLEIDMISDDNELGSWGHGTSDFCKDISKLFSSNFW